jgi:CBS domain-containing protein
MELLQSLSDEPVSQLGPLPLHTVTPNQTVRDALQTMQSNEKGCVVVCDGRRPIGVLTERDILRRMGASLPLDEPVRNVISGEVWSIRSSDSLATAVRIMTRRRCRNLVVMSPEQEALGVLSVKRVVRAIVEHFPSSIYNLPPAPDQVPKDREGA